MSPFAIGFIIFLVAFWALCATLYLIDVNANVRRLEWELERTRREREYWRAAAAKANLDCYQRHADLYGDKPNA